jgi:hypothetical protein
MTILFDVMLGIQRRIGDGKHGQADSGNVTILVDTELNEADDYWNGGTVFFISGVTLLNNKTAVVTDFTASSDTVTFATQAAAISSSVVYEIYTQKFDRQLMVKAINQAMGMIDIPDWDESTTVTANTLRYALPTGVSRVRRVQVGNHTDGWEDHNWWREEDGYLMFYKSEPDDTSDSIRMQYAKNNAAVNADSDTIDPALVLDRLIEEAIVNILTFRLFQIGTDEPNTMELLKFHQGQLAIARSKHPQAVKHAPRYADW